MKCKKCGEESNRLVQSGGQGKITWENLGYCPKCWNKYRKEKGIKSLREIDDEMRKKERRKT